MPVTFADLQTEVFSDEFDPTKYRTFVKRWLNEAAQKVSREVQIGSLEQGQLLGPLSWTGSKPYVTYQELADATGGSLLIEQMLHVVTPDGPIDEVPYIDLAAAQLTSPAVGTPEIWAVFNDTLHLYPTPRSGTQVSIIYRRSPTDFSALSDSATVPWPEDFLDVLVNYARSKCFAMEDDPEMANFYMGWYQQGVAQMRARLQTRTKNNVRQIQGQIVDSWYPRFRRP